jgi:hypothetical protein
VKKVHVLVEGQTEEAFVNRVVNPELAPRRIHLIPIVLSTKRTKDGHKFRGGVSKFARMRRDLLRLLGDSSAAAVTTMVDYYGLPGDFPGLDDLPKDDAYARVSHLEEALRRDLDDRRLIPYLSLHEFEALVLADPRGLASTFPDERGLASHFDRLLTDFDSPEEINDGETTHPAARLAARLPRYQKTLHGPLITARLGLSRLRGACPHFNAWIARLEALGTDR